MGDNIYLGDRNGVRTPMQWNGDRNAGFSRASPARLYSPVIMDPIYGYEAINVEAQQSDPSSLLNWMRNMIALRKLFRVFGRGIARVPASGEPQVLAYVRALRETSRCSASRTSRASRSRSSSISRPTRGCCRSRCWGMSSFPSSGASRIRLTLGPYGFMWFEFHGDPQAIAARASQTLEHEMPLDLSRGWEGLFDGFQRERLETPLLPRFLPAQRWFGAKTRRIVQARVEDWGPLADSGAVMTVVRRL